ncbi:MAG: hypothetical protein WCA08_12205 [Desulfoferrobacter sp.]
MFRELVHKAHGTSLIFLYLMRYGKRLNLSEDELQFNQNRMLRNLIRFAAQKVPYYVKLFEDLRIDPCTIQTVEDLENLPLLGKETVRQNPEMFRPAPADSLKTLELITSGSTGQATKIYHDYASLYANVAFGERERKIVLESVNPSDFDYRELSIVYPSSALLKMRQFYDENTFLYLRKRRFAVSVSEPIERICAEVNRLRPDVLVSYGSFLEYFFKLITVRRISLALPKVVVYAGDMMTGEGKSFIEDCFGIPVFSVYNAVEVFKIGFYCKFRNGFHIHDDICHLRTIGQDGKTKPHGETGEIVVSNLLNRGSVLLNYQIGDRGALEKNTCPCGRKGLLLADLQGRVEDLIVLPNGEIVHPRVVWGVFKGLSEILQYQLVQHDVSLFELKMATSDKATFDRLLPSILAKLRILLGHAARLEVFYSVELRREGKFRTVISNVKNKGLD